MLPDGNALTLKSNGHFLAKAGAPKSPRIEGVQYRVVRYVKIGFQMKGRGSVFGQTKVVGLCYLRSMNSSLRAKENLHIVFWLLKDFAWISDYKILGLAMAVPTVLLSLLITWLSRSDRSELAHNLAISCWISANAIWMLGEFYFDDSKRHWALPFFIAGLCILALHYMRVCLERLKS